MKFLLMMSSPAKGDYEAWKWPEQDMKNHIGFMIGFAKKLRESGELLTAEGLASPAQAKLVRAGQDGKPVTDGVFPETKEFLAGYWFIEVESAERAYEIAAEASAAPGKGGVAMNIAIEVREVMSVKPKVDDVMRVVEQQKSPA